MNRLLLALAALLLAVTFGDAHKDIGFKRSFISPNDAAVRKWSSTGMGGLDHHESASVDVDSIDAVDLTSSKKITKKIEDDEDHPNHFLERHPWGSGAFADDFS